MNAFIFFIKKTYVLLLFIVMEVAAINFYSDSTSYTRARMLTVSNHLLGGVNRAVSAVGDYFGLRRENDALLKEVAGLRNELERYKAAMPDTLAAPPPSETGRYFYSTASVISNSVARQENFIIIDKGQRDGVLPNMALISPENTLVGYVMNTSERFSVAVSALNTAFRTGGMLKGKDFFGSIYWDGTDNGVLTLSEIPQYADIAVGDTVVTAYSSIFPDGVLIGRVESFRMTPSSYYQARVRMATNMSKLKTVLLSNYADIQERMMIEKEIQADNGIRK